MNIKTISAILLVLSVFVFQAQADELHDAAIKGDTAKVRQLLKNGADINGRDFWQLTPLHLAAANDHAAATKILIERGADVNARGLLQETPLHGAAEKGHTEIVNFLIAKGAVVNVKDHNGKTPLHLAAENGHAAATKILIERGADVNVRDLWQYTPLDWAAGKGHTEITKLLGAVSKGHTRTSKVPEAKGTEAQKSSGPDGFCGIKWGASRKAVLEAIKGWGWQLQREEPGVIMCRGLFNGQSAYLIFTMLKDSFVSGVAYTAVVSINDMSWAEISYKNIVEAFGKKYGPPKNDVIRENYLYSVWTFFDAVTKDKLYISVTFPKYSSFIDYDRPRDDLTAVIVQYDNASLRERLKESDL